MSYNTVKELSDILSMVHNVNSTAPEQVKDMQVETWFDRYVLRFF